MTATGRMETVVAVPAGVNQQVAKKPVATKFVNLERPVRAARRRSGHSTKVPALKIVEEQPSLPMIFTFPLAETVSRIPHRTLPRRVTMKTQSQEMVVLSVPLIPPSAGTGSSR